MCEQACRLCVERARYRLAFVEMAEAHGTETGFVAGAGERSDLEKLAWRRQRSQGESDDLIENTLSTETPAVCNDLKSTPENVRRRQELLNRGYRAIAKMRLLKEFAGGVSLALAAVMERTTERTA